MNEKSRSNLDLEGKWSFRVGGIAAIVLTIGYLLTFPIYAWVGNPPPSGVEAQLIYFAEHATGWWLILVLMVLTDLLMIPIFLALYHALKGINRNLMLIAIAFIGLFITLDLAITWTTRSAMITTGVNHASAASDAERAMFVAAAGYPSAMLDSPLSSAYAIVFPALGVLFTGMVMLKGIFNKTTAYLALAMGITGLAVIGKFVVDALEPIAIINALLAMVWYLFAGITLYRLSRQ